MGRTSRGIQASRSRLAGALSSVALLASASPAWADWDFQLSAGVNGGWVRRAPTLDVAAVSTPAREMGAGEIKQRNGLAMIGLGGDLEIVVDDRWRVPLGGAYVYWAAGPYDGTVTSYDGSIARLRPWSASRFDLLLPGVGRRWKHRRWMYGAAVRAGVSWFDMNGTVAAGRDAVSLDLSARTVVVQVELEGCRRLDPTTRLCLQVAPRVYDHELVNGVTFGLRMEWGR